ncbi:MAG: peptidylprolyl isomerase [Bacteroidota bacterium]
MGIRLRNVFLSLSIIAGLSYSCKSTKSGVATKPQSQEITSPNLLSFAKGAVSQSEFERVYAKNNGGREEVAAHTTEQYREYLDLYIKFKRKVFEAEDIGLDTTPAFKQEFETYRKQLVKPYLSAKEVENKLVQEAYDRSKYIVSASHLLLGAKENTPPADTLATYNKILAIRDSILSGQKTFEEMAIKYSEDPSAAQNKGDLGYFTVFEMVYPFENAAYTTATGSVSTPVRTRFGYHLLKVKDKKENVGKKQVAHIIVRIGDRYSAKNEEEAKAKIQEIHEKLSKGEDFATLASQYSDDPSSAQKGGDLGTGRLLPEMESRKIQLQEGDFSEPFKTRFGWHILSVSSVEKVKSFEEAEAALKQKISRDSRSQLSKKALINRLKKENKYEFNEANFNSFIANLDNQFPRGSWRPDSTQEGMSGNTLISLKGGEKTYSLGDFIEFYQTSRPRKPGMTPQDAAKEVYKSFSEDKLLAYEESQLPAKNPEFRHLLQEYRDGILLFTLMEQKVWKKAVEDTTGLKTYYEGNKSLFHKDKTIDVREYRTTEKDAIQKVANLLAQNHNDEYIDSLLNQQSKLTLRIINQTYETGDENVPADMFDKGIGEKSDIIGENNFFRILVLESKNEAGIPPFDKVKSEAITRYQEHLEKTWLDELAQKYPVEIDEAVFNKLYK